MTPATSNPRSPRTIRSFVRRAGRLTSGQKKAIETLWPKFGIEYAVQPLDLDEIFERHAPRTMEIGFGNGELLVDMAANAPERDFIGVEVHEPGVGHCLMSLEDRHLSNVRIICQDAVEVLRNQVPDRALEAVNLFFPDPWPKKRHHKRRIVQPEFIELLGCRMAARSLLHTATDWDEYAEHIGVVVSANRSFEAVEMVLGERLQTKFEQRGKRLGHGIREQFFRRL